jgi:hypothetical protein
VVPGWLSELPDAWLVVPLLVGIGADLLGTGMALALMWAAVLLSTLLLWRALP